MIWFRQLTSESELYNGKHNRQNSISAENISALNGELASPNSLLTQIKELDKKLDIKVDELKGKKDYNKWVLQAIAVLLLGLWIKSCTDNDQLRKGYEYGINNKTVIEEAKALNIDSIVSKRVDSILSKKLEHDTISKTK